MPKVKLTDKQSRVFTVLSDKEHGTFDLDDVIPALFAPFKKPQNNQRTRAASVVQAIGNKFDCQCCFIDRISPTGRGHKASYRFRIDCAKGS